jgi:hypothetical protein
MKDKWRWPQGRATIQQKESNGRGVGPGSARKKTAMKGRMEKRRRKDIVEAKTNKLWFREQK